MWSRTHFSLQRVELGTKGGGVLLESGLCILLFMHAGVLLSKRRVQRLDCGDLSCGDVPPRVLQCGRIWSGACETFGRDRGA